MPPPAGGIQFITVDVTFVRGSDTQIRDRVFLGDGERGRRVAVHVVHDLPHLVVESVFGITDGLWSELAAGRHHEADRAASARNLRYQKRGRVVSGAASGASTAEWLTEAHRVAKVATNSVVNRWGDGPDTAEGVRARLVQHGHPALAALAAELDDEAIELAIQGVRGAERRWLQTPPGGTLRLAWPLSRQQARELAAASGE